MKILFISRATLFEDAGGDTIQVIKTAENLRKLGVEVDIMVSKEKINYAGYDLLHFFNIIRPADILPHVKKSGKPFVVSTIYVDYSEYEKRQRKGFAGFLFRMLSPDLIEFSKTIARSVIKGEKIKSLSYFFIGQRGAIKKILKEAKCLLPNSDSEYRRLTHHYRVKQKYRAVPNAIDPLLFVGGNNEFVKEKNMVLCVGRIEGRKNQLNLIKALNNSAFQLIIIGAPAPNQTGYFNACREIAAANIKFIDRLSQNHLIEYYKRASVHALPSWFETTGLSSLEAAVMGCNIVITDRGDTQEYFEDMAYYCEPEKPASIRHAVEEASSNPLNEKLQQKILQKYTWDIAARTTLDAYQEVLDKRI